MRAFESDFAVIFVAMEVRPAERSGTHGDRLGPSRTIVVAANGEEPLVARLRLAAARCEGRPGNAALDGPALVAVAGLVKRPL